MLSLPLRKERFLFPSLTFHDVDEGAHIAFFNNTAVFVIVHWIHTVHDLLDLRHFQILHEVVVQDSWLDQILWPVQCGQNAVKRAVMKKLNTAHSSVYNKYWQLFTKIKWNKMHYATLVTCYIIIKWPHNYVEISTEWYSSV